VSESPEVGSAAKLEFLRRPDAYPDRPREVEVVETHFAWVFLSRRFVYKLKKPIRFHVVDFTTVSARRANCELEIVLNRRLAEAVYIGVVPLVLAGGRLALDGGGEVVDWLVKMRRLPRERMLDQAAMAGRVGARECRALIDKLVRFYRRADRPRWSPARYAGRLERAVRGYAAQLQSPELGIDAARVQQLEAAQLGFLARHGDIVAARIEHGRVVDAHGDLRPEHVYLSEEPQIIDCLEFSTDLRWLDSAEEICFLALECRRLGRDRLADELGALYRERANDPVPPELWAFYRSHRASIRALLCAWHLQDEQRGELRRRWLERAHWYLDAAESSIAAASCGSGF
jgi:aminoglycoside phosphotransferase family enzyme